MAGPGWYLRRLGAMTPREIVRRLRDEAVKQWLRMGRTRVRPASDGGLAAVPGPMPLPGGGAGVEAAEAAEIVAAAEQLLGGRWKALGVEWTEVHPDPDWFLDPETGQRAPQHRYTFDIDPRDPRRVGNIKNTWELSRHHHVTVLAAAYCVSGRDEFAAAASHQLESWWEENAFLEGVHWRSGIEIGLRLIAWTWIRRLLDAWGAAPGRFEGNPVFRRQLYHHLYYLARMPSHGSSANNHLLAEAAGSFVACCAFPLFPESAGWRDRAAEVLRREARRQTFPSGLNRELATGYHGFVLELLLAAAVEGEAAGHSLGSEMWAHLCGMTDALAAVVDTRLEAPRQGDDDEGTALQVTGRTAGRWRSLLATGAALFGPGDWWPIVPTADARTTWWASLVAGPVATGSRPVQRPSAFLDAGMVLLRDPGPGPAEIWCRCDGGPHGYLSIAGHAHADALSVELRVGGTTVLAEPGTYCYHTEPAWREYFRSTRGHNTLELADVDQSLAGGPFHWTRHAGGVTVAVSGVEEGPEAEWIGEHDGYLRLDPPARHRRRVHLNRELRRVTIEDRIVGTGSHRGRLAFHLGPEIECRLAGTEAELEWATPDGGGRAAMHLPDALTWEAVRGRSDPPAGWFSPSLGVKVPSITLFGTGNVDAASRLVTIMDFDVRSGSPRGRPMQEGPRTGDRGLR